MRTIDRSLFLLLALVIGISGCASGPSVKLGADELDAIAKASDAYTQAWLANDAELVMGTFVSEPVLSPSGMPFKKGQSAARAFWWPKDGPKTTVTRFDTSKLEVSGSGDLAYVRGAFVLEFTYHGAAYQSHGKFLHLLRRVSGVGWRISHHFWDDLPSD
ncbi:MAG: DUF4440 domain-containing protein [Candidatus Eisenbacteria bacterium]|uniref:DUF4440 domain-containing protein n=1 Tax=Eiseniibacteriota bacterium TaxID=2212470 RepID=A0A7Y2E678_UNCEI|nr:DUF4440 domain-containing protein [Candidatus Eisenbacteria bacterium]